MRRAIGPAVDELGLRTPAGRHWLGLQTTTPRPCKGQGVVASRLAGGARDALHPVAWPASRPAQISTLATVLGDAAVLVNAGVGERG